jgi:hypothetical protein
MENLLPYVKTVDVLIATTEQTSLVCVMGQPHSIRVKGTIVVMTMSVVQESVCIPHVVATRIHLRDIVQVDPVIYPTILKVVIQLILILVFTAMTLIHVPLTPLVVLEIIPAPVLKHGTVAHTKTERVAMTKSIVVPQITLLVICRTRPVKVLTELKASLGLMYSLVTRNTNIRVY